ncbi:hypothetical protein AS034_16350 [[Bacillus] enclensis]|uniref:Double zinc ribbon n=1 Tax=[Bacillus] enclensis TaxID=1402860 RepID=A0A0V8HCU1_9BACI|nr:zinc ribbon domain-containing protein [[Bacillus] enclensis]KSU60411.1 hypothetical protein AS034_16350 [[Bacillus] enclensis]SCC24214.1 Double zinc ribbon [[Bacillus] enclensis]
MYCKHCGTKNKEDALYCINDGEALSLHNEQVLLQKENNRYCSNCSHENQASALYCMACGHTMSKVKEITEGEPKRANVQTMTADTRPAGILSTLTDMNSLKRLAVWNGISLAGLLLISLIISSAVNGVLRDALRGDFGALIDGIKLLSFSDVFMISHMIGVDYFANAMMFEGVLSTTSGLFNLLLLPAVVFTITGYLMNRKQPEQPFIEKMKWNVSFSVLYGAVIGIISTFAGVSMEMTDPTGFFDDMTITLGSDYPFLESVFNGFVISFIFTGLGAVFSMGKETRSFNGHYGLSISKAILHSMTGLVIMMAAGAFIISSHDELSTEEPAADILLGTQVGGYLWNVAQFESLTFDLTADGESVHATYSLLGGPKASEDQEGFAELFEEISWIWIFAFIPAALHLWAGNQLRKASGGNILQELAAYAIAFGVINAVVVAISKLTISTNFEGVFDASFGFSAISTGIISAILAFGVSYLGVMVTNRQEPVQTSRAA